MEALHIFIYNEIGMGGTKPDEIQNQLDANRNAEEIIVHISSPGGEVFDGWTIGNILAQSGKKVTAVIEGLCASIATYIALKADNIQMAETGRFMIHNPTGGVQGDATAMGNAKDLLESITDDLVRLYVAKTGLDEEKVRQMMNAETFLNPVEARTMGFVDEIIDAPKAVAYLDKKHINMTPKEKNEAKGILQKIEALFKKFHNVNPTNIMVELADGGMVFVESEDGDLTGKNAFTVNDEGERTDTPAPDGDHELVDGRVLVVSDGVVTEVREGSDDEATAAMKKEIADLKAELEKVNNEKKETDKSNAEVLDELVEQVNNLSKLTVGGSFKPSVANIKPNQVRNPEKPKSKLGSWGSELPALQNLKRN